MNMNQNQGSDILDHTGIGQERHIQNSITETQTQRRKLEEEINYSLNNCVYLEPYCVSFVA